MSLLVAELENLQEDGGWQRAPVPGKFIPPGLEKCPDRARAASAWFAPSLSDGTK